MDDDDEYGCARQMPSVRFRPVDLLHVLAVAVRDMTQAVSDMFDGLDDLACMHANYQVDRDRVRDEMVRDIEAITRGGDG